MPSTARILASRERIWNNSVLSQTQVGFDDEAQVGEKGCAAVRVLSNSSGPAFTDLGTEATRKRRSASRLSSVHHASKYPQ